MKRAFDLLVAILVLPLLGILFFGGWALYFYHLRNPGNILVRKSGKK